MEKSKCCKAEIKDVCADEKPDNGSTWNRVCTKCGEFCDIHVEEMKDSEEEYIEGHKKFHGEKKKPSFNNPKKINIKDFPINTLAEQMIISLAKAHNNLIDYITKK